MNIYQKLAALWIEPVVEPVKRNKGNGLQWIIHRFPIRGGISRREAMLRDMARPTPLLRYLAGGKS